MNTTAIATVRAASYGAAAAAPIYPGAPRIMFAPETGSGSGGAGDADADAIAAAAAAASTQKHAEDQAAAEKAAADAAETKAQKELEDAEAAAALEADKGKDSAALAAEKRDLLREVMDKKSKLKEAQAAAAAAAEQLKAYEGVDVAKYRELVKKEKDAETAAAEARGDFEAVKKAMAEEHQKATKTLEERIADLESKLSQKDQVIDTLTVGNDFGSSAFIRESLTLTPAKARQLYGDHFEVKDGKTVAYDKPKSAANRNPLVDASGNPLVFDEAFKRIIEADPDKETMLKAKVNPGSNSKTTPATVDKKPLTGLVSGVDRIRASLEKGA